jgi:hypothetical protein
MLHADGTNLSGTPIDLGGMMQTSPAMGDIDGDGKVEVIQPVASDGTIRLIEVDSPGVRPESLIWPMQQHDAAQTSFLDDFPKEYAVGDPPDWLGGAEHAGSLSEPRIWSTASAEGMTLHLLVHEPGTLSLAVFDLRGRKVATPVDDREVRRGEYTVQLPGIDALGSGIYFARASIRAPQGIATGNSRIVVIR